MLERTKGRREKGVRGRDGWMATPINEHELGPNSRDGEDREASTYCSPCGAESDTNATE